MWKAKGFVIVCSLLALTGIICLIVGIVFLKNSDCANTSPSSAKSEPATKCSHSPEAIRIGLPEFFQKVQDTYFLLHPDQIASKPGVQANEVHKKFLSYDPSPERLKQITDKSQELLRELQSKTLAKHKLKSRERKGFAQMIHFLNTTFGKPYDGNYYSGDYLLGPTMFCDYWQRICRAGIDNYSVLKRFKPSNVDDVQQMLEKIKAINHTFIQYKANLMFGAKSGMVRSLQPCQVGVETLTGRLGNKKPEDIVKSPWGYLHGEVFLASLSAEERQKWFDKTGKLVNQSIADHLLDYVGKPLYELSTYMRTTYLEHCVPSNVSSGFASLPLSHIYVNQTKTSQKTHPYLPDGSPLNGSLAYKNHILPFFTTTAITPDEVHELGHEMIAKLYSQIIGLAREYTNQRDNVTAAAEFHEKLNASDMYYADNIPEIESNATAWANCRSEESAKKNCPVRWAAIQAWFDDVNKVMSTLDSETVHMFHFVGSKHTTPNCPVKPKPNFNPNMGVPSYRSSSSQCPGSASYLVPFFLSRPGPKFTQLSVNSHEARPGHHTQVQGNIEHFADSCGGVIGWLNKITRYTAFVEGWGLYAEKPLIADNTDVYIDKPLDKYGMLRGQLWRAIRLVVDTGLHFKRFSRQEALNYFKDYIWDDSDVVEKEITRYQSNPGQATTYMIGQLHLIKLRARAQEELGNKFKLKDFHYHLLKDGSATLNYLTESIEGYIRCTKNSKGDGCDDVLAPNEEINSSSSNAETSEFETHYVVESYY